MATPETILGFRNLTRLVESIKSGIPTIVPPEFLTPGTNVSGNTAEYYQVQGTRQVARQAHYGSPARRRELVGVQRLPITLMHAFESEQWPMAMMINLTKMTDLSRDTKGEQQAALQSRIFKKRFANLRIAATLYALFQGKIYTTTDGNLAPSSTTTGVTTATTIDFKVPNSNTGNCSGVVSTLWSAATAPIMTELRQLQTLALKTTGYELEHAFYSDEVPGYIGRNTEAQNYLKLNPAMNQQYLTTTAVPNGFGGIKNWHPAGSAFFNDNDGTNQAIMPASTVVFTPAYDPEWFETLQGSYLVPNSIFPMIGGDAENVLKNNTTELFGMFGYGLMSMNPVMVEQFAGDTFLPVLKVPAAIFQMAVG